MPYHTRLQTEVYHTSEKCTVGNNIEKRHRVEGAGRNLRLCKTCRGLRKKRSKPRR